MTVLTISTVGYKEVRPLTPLGQYFTSIFILINIGLFAYVVSVFTKYIFEGEIFKNMHEKFIQREIEQLSNHIIICGYGRYGRNITAQVEKQGIPFVLIDKSEDIIKNLKEADKKWLYILGDTTKDEVLLQARIDHAKAIIIATGDETENLFTVLSARQLNKEIKIISRVMQKQAERKFILAGADHAVIPENIGGYIMSTLVTKPRAVEFFKLISEEYETDIHFEQITYENLPEHWKGKSLQDLDLLNNYGLNIIGYKQTGDRYTVNPKTDCVLKPGECFVIIGNSDQLSKLAHDLNVDAA